MPRRFFRFLILGLAFFAHLAAFMQFHTQVVKMPLIPGWQSQFDFLLIVSFVLALIFPFCRQKFYVWLLFVFRSILLLVMSLPMGQYLGAELTLAALLIIEGFEYLNLLEGLIFSTCMIGIMLGVKTLPITAWGKSLESPTVYDLWSFGVYGCLIIILSGIIRYHRDTQKAALEIKSLYQDSIFQLSQVNLQLQEYAVTVEKETLINERKRLAREIHDTLAYTLTNLVMMLEAAKFLISHHEKDLADHIERARVQASEGLTEVHRALQALRPVQMSEISGLPAIQHLVNSFTRATQLVVALEFGNTPLNFGEEADLVAYRLVQEGITNALRHGHATHIVISFSCVVDKVHIIIKDNGVGSDGIKEGYGLSGMRERIERLGGRLEVSCNPGYKLLAIIPIAKE